ncbi:MAG: DUF4140 domain-containing protein [Candidatus Schmidhempelia sp.]|nr:DUF4140 domain-containing protein [Candidatus Schmidhempelia sp.]
MFLSLSLLISFACNADSIKTEFSVDRVTLYLKGAELSGRSIVQIPAGKSEIILMKVAKDIYPAYITIDVAFKAMILAATLNNDYLMNSLESAQVKKLKQQLQLLQKIRG